MTTIKTAVASAFLALLSSNIAYAGEITWNGFMSVAAGKTLDTDSEYVVDAVTGGTYTDELLFTPESMMALQAQSTITDKLRATVQIVAHGANQFDPAVEWAFLSYDISDNFTLNAGRIRLPLYFYSDYLDVGYAYNWVRPPMDVYSIPQSGLEGVSLRFNGYIADTVEVNAETWYGSSDLHLDPPDDFEYIGPFKVRDDMGVNAIFSWEWLQFRLLYNQLDTSSEILQISTGDTFGGEITPVTYKSVAFMVDKNNFKFRSEYTKLDNGSKTDSGYLTLAYSFGDFTPHLTRSFIDAKGDGGFFLPSETKSNILGLNWAFSPSAVLKLEYINREVDSQVFDFATFTLADSHVETPMFSIAIDLLF